MYLSMLTALLFSSVHRTSCSGWTLLLIHIIIKKTSHQRITHDKANLEKWEKDPSKLLHHISSYHASGLLFVTRSDSYQLKIYTRWSVWYFTRQKYKGSFFNMANFLIKFKSGFYIFPPQYIFFYIFIWWRLNAFFNWYSLINN